MKQHVPSPRELERDLRRRGWRISSGGKHRLLTSPDGTFSFPVYAWTGRSAVHNILARVKRFERSGQA